ncbi:MAG TPA: hypothetical protein VF472_14125 [Burkholderiaceae bacterium]
MQSGLFQANRSIESTTPGEERAWGMHDVSYSFEAQLEDDAYLLPVSRKPRRHIVASLMDFARRLTKH